MMLHGSQVVDRHVGGRELFFMEGKDPQSDQPIDIVRVHTAEDGTKTRSGRIPMARSVHVAGAEAQNHFTPGVREFSGTAEPGATIVARDHAQDKTLFSTEVGEGTDGTGTWSAEAELDAETEYTIPVDPSIEEPEFFRDWVTPWASRTVMGNAGDDALHRATGTEVLDRNAPGSLFFLTLSDRYVNGTAPTVSGRSGR